MKRLLLALKLVLCLFPSWDKPPVVESLHGKVCDYGPIRQHGRMISFGSMGWEAFGHVEDDGLVRVFWQSEWGGEVTTGEYRLEEEHLAGTWHAQHGPVTHRMRLYP